MEDLSVPFRPVAACLAAAVRPACLVALALVMGMVAAPTVTAQPQSSDVAIVIHGGAGTILPDRMTDEQERRYRAALEEALQAGHDVLTRGGSSTEAVVAAITTMETSPLFNAGKGAVFTSENTVELDASIMDGATRNAGALTGVKRVKHPIKLARLIMNESRHVMMAQEGAEAFAEEHGMEMVDNSYFYTERRREQAMEARDDEEGGPSDPTGAMLHDKDSAPSSGNASASKFGTVGTVALDQDGNLAAGTSTGGLTNKEYGRVGDSPIIGAGTYAHNATCGVSSTGHGEYFMRAVVAHEIAARMRHGGMSVQEAARSVVMDELPGMPPDGGGGGVIAMDAEGNIAMPFNTPGMYRGYINTDGEMVIRIFKDEEDASMDGE